MSDHRDEVHQWLSTHLGIELASLGGHRSARLVESLAGVSLDADAESLARDHACVGETHFMRHPDQLGLLARHLRRVNGASVWSAACATGEEAWSVAGVLSRHLSDFRVLGTDINPDFVAKARRGRYASWSLRGLDPEDVPWLRGTPKAVEVSDELRARVDFDVWNLLTGPRTSRFDAVLCRNVLLYFTPASRLQVIDHLVASLRDGGLLLFGGLDMFDVDHPLLDEHVEGRIRYYVRRSEVRPEAPTRSSSAAPIERRPLPPSKPPRVEPPPPSPRASAPLASIRVLAEGPEWATALEQLEAHIVQEPLDVDAHILAAMVADEHDLRDDAAAHARAACFLAPEEPWPQFLFGQVLVRRGSRRGLEHIRRAATALQGRDPSQPLPHALGLTGRHLQRMLDGFLEPA